MMIVFVEILSTMIFIEIVVVSRFLSLARSSWISSIRGCHMICLLLFKVTCAQVLYLFNQYYLALMLIHDYLANDIQPMLLNPSCLAKDTRPFVAFGSGSESIGGKAML